MILKRNLTLNYINNKQALLSAIVGLAVLPGVSLASKPNASLTSNQYEQQNKSLAYSAPKISGKAAFNYAFEDTGANKVRSKRKYGEWAFNRFSLCLRGASNDIHYKVEYLWYQSATTGTTYDQPLEIYLGHTFDNGIIGQVGNTTVPFGILNNLSWWKNMPFYAGFGDNYKPGFKVIYNSSPWSFHMQLGKDNLISREFKSSVTPKITSNINAIGPGLDSEDNLQVNGRLAYTHHFHDSAKAELGLSGKLGNTYNIVSTRKGKVSAYAFHLNGCWEKLQAQFQFIPYNYSLKSNLSNNLLNMSKDAKQYTIPTKANIYSFGLAYKIPVTLGKIREITVYDDYSVLSGKRTVVRSKMNIVGAKFMTGPLFLAADIVSGKNMYNVGEQNNAAGVLVINNIGANNVNGDGWKTKINVNFGAKF